MTKTQTVGETTEPALIRRVSRILGPAPEGVLGIGDDGAILPEPVTRIVVSTDSLVEGTHFKLGWITARDLGRRAAAIAVSDLAAMGATSLAAVAALNIPKTLSIKEFDGLLQGLGSARKRWNLPFVGGNLATSRELALNVTVWGGLSEKPFLREGAKPGHWVLVTGVPGWAHLGLALLQKLGPGPHDPEAHRALANLSPGARQALNAWIHPEPRFDVVDHLRLLQPTAVLDTSDSLVQSVGHLLGKTLDIDMVAPQIPKTYRELAEHLGMPPEEAWYHGGEDYHLCFALRPALAKQLLERKGFGSVPVTLVGTLGKGTGKIRTAEGNSPQGEDFSHFG